MDNKTFLDDLKFGIGDGNLHYYLFNWKCPDLKPEQASSTFQWKNYFTYFILGRIGTSIITILRMSESLHQTVKAARHHKIIDNMVLWNNYSLLISH